MNDKRGDDRSQLASHDSSVAGPDRARESEEERSRGERGWCRDDCESAG